MAFAVLRAVTAEDAYANLVLPRLLRESHLPARDAALATEYAYGTLRGRGTYDAVLAACCDRPLAAVDPVVLDALRLGAHQLLSTRTAAHAAVSETVDLVRRETNRGAAGFANAVLRRVSRRDLTAWLDEVAPAPGDDAALAVRTSHPSWLVPALRGALAAHGRPAGELDALLVADNARPRVTLVALPGLADAAALATVSGAAPAGDDEEDVPARESARQGRWAPTAVVISGGAPADLADVAAGRARVQDEGSQLVALALLAAPLADAGPQGGPEGRLRPGAASGPGATSSPGRATGTDRAPRATGERWLDLCAGPGGKAALLAASAAQATGSGTSGSGGARLTAVEVAPHRARLVTAALAPLPGAAWEVLVADGRQVGAQQPGAFDRVLLDAPCTGTGALRRRPEARWRRTEADLADLTVLQGELLASALAAVRPGGVVAYCTCSPLAAETVDVVADATARGDVELLDAPAALASVAGHEIPDVGEGLTAQLWPHRHGTDAMFLALLRRR